jgi:penicillin-binding protein 2B
MKKRKRKNYAVRNIIIVTLVLMVVISSNVFLVSVGQLHFLSGTDLSVYADNQNVVTETEQALRGEILDRNGNVIAQDNKTYNIVCILDSSRPSVGDDIAYVKDKEHTAEVLSSILKMDKQKILDYLSQDKYQTELGLGGRNLSKSVKDEIEATDLTGIEFTDSIQRVYPNNVFASNLIGYAQSDENGDTVGKMGLELYLDSYLKGTDGYRTYQVDKDGYVLPGMKEETVSAVNGNNVYLTLDSGIQSALEQSFQITEETFNADRAWGGAMEISTGKVIAWGQTPSYNPNTLEDIEDYTNIGAQTPYEPGSTLKTFTWAAAINEGVYDGNATADGNEFCFTSDSNNDPVQTYSTDNYGCIYNARKKQYGEIDLDHGLIYSLNTVAATIQTQYITPEIHLEYLKKFGFFSNVNTDGLPESSGLLNFTWPADKLSLSYGQGSTVTMLQLFQAYSAIFSDGTMVKPYFVDKIVDSYDSSNVVYQAETQVVGNPITADTAKQVQSIMYRVVNDEDGSARYYQIPECKIIAKTGTTQVADSSSDGNAYETSNKTIVSLMAALPADNPQVLVYYAFEADYNPNAHAETEAITSFLRKVAQTYGFSDSNTSSSDEQTTQETVTVSTMPDLLNHTVDYASNKLSSTGCETIVLGDGNTVIDQFPKTDSSVVSGQRVFLLTDTNSFTMPDMTGWTRKDVSSLWAVTGYAFELSGEGTVTSQSISPGTVVTKGTTIQVEFG